MPLGVSILDLLPMPAGVPPFPPGSTVPPGAQNLIPAGLRAFLENFAAVDLSSWTTTAATFYAGTINPLAQALELEDELRGWFIQGAGFDRGVRFQLALLRAGTPAGGNIEAAPVAWQLDLFVEQLSIRLPFLKAARLIPGAGTSPAHLEPDAAAPDVRIVGDAVLRIAPGASGAAALTLVDMPDPLAFGATTGSVATVQFSPPHFFIANSAIGMTVRKLTFDASTAYTPAVIMARNHGPDWTGLAISEALLYLPRDTPLVGNLVLGVRDVLLGDPFGLQGELRVEWGSDSVSATQVEVLQANESGFETLTVQPNDESLDRTVVIEDDRPLRFFARCTPTDANTRWLLPDGSAAQGVVTPEFSARDGDTLIIVRSEKDSAGEWVEGPEIRHHFSADFAAAPQIELTRQGRSYQNVVNLSGAREVLGAMPLLFTSNPAPDAADADLLTWQLGTGATTALASGASFELANAARLPDAGMVDLTLTDSAGRVRRLRIEVLAGASLLVGTEAGVFEADGTLEPLAVQAVERTIELAPFHAEGLALPAAQAALMMGIEVEVLAGTLARVSVAAAPPVPVESRHTRLRMVFDEASPSHEGEDVEALEQLLANFPAGRLVLIGRCDDVGVGSSDEESAAYNATLAHDRAAVIAAKLIMLGVAADRIVWLGEQDTAWNKLDSGAADPNLGELGVAEDQEVPSWYARGQEDVHPAPNSLEESTELRLRREEYRRVDVYAEGDSIAAPAAPPAGFDAQLRRAWLPGADGALQPLLLPTAPPLIHRVSLRVAWDSPTVATLADALPTLAEITVAYESEKLSELSNMPAGDLNGTQIEVIDGSGNDAEVLTVTGRWTYDAQSGETVFAASVDSTGDPLGLFHINGDAIALAAAFGPAVVAAVTPAFPGANAVGIAAVAAASLALQSAVAEGSGRVVCTGLAIEHRQRALTSLVGSSQELLFDYESSFMVDASVGGLLTLKTTQPIKVRYRNVGIRLDSSQAKWWEVASFVFDGISMEVAEPGQWEIDGPLGKMLGIVAVRMGTGSTWFEVDMVFNLDLGVVRITSATIRITAGDGGLGVEVRGLGVAVSIPGVLEGAGVLALQDGGSLSAHLDVTVIPAGISAGADLSLETVPGDPEFTFVAIGIRVILPVGIPLANTGLGIFGFVGQFASNGQRTVALGPDIDPVQAELEWFTADFANKYGPQKDQWVLGLGVIVGTLPDMAFTFNAEGMLAIAFPDPSVVLGINAKLMSLPKEASDQGGDPIEIETSLVGLIAIDSEAVMLGARGQVIVPEVLEMTAPLSAYFPFPGGSGAARGSYIHLGADNITAADLVGNYTRPGDPVSVKLLPALLDVQAFAYAMVEPFELHSLGGDARFSFDGFALGFGAGFNIDWKSGPITLDASAKLLVGLGTSPFKLVGSLEVDGVLDLKVVGVSANGNIVIELIGNGDGTMQKHLAGEFCGEIDLGFFSLEGCVGIDIGTKLTETIPVPPFPLAGVELTDRRGARVATAAVGEPGVDHTVWPDTVPVLSFTHVPQLGIDFEAGWTLAAQPNNGSPWSGSSELKYAFRLYNVQLFKHTAEGLLPVQEGTGALDAVFWLPGHRGGVLGAAEGDALPSEHEGSALALLSWVPFAVFRHLSNGGEGLPADPAQTYGRVCEKVRIAHPGCAFGADAVPALPGGITIEAERIDGDPLVAGFTLHATATLGGLSWRELIPAALPLGLHAVPGAVVSLARPRRLPGEPTLHTQGFELPALAWPERVWTTLGWVARIEPAIVEGQVLLEISDLGGNLIVPDLCFSFADVDQVHNAMRWHTQGARFVKTAGAAMYGASGHLTPGVGTLRIVLPLPMLRVELVVEHFSSVASVTARDLGGHALETRVLTHAFTLQHVVFEGLGPIADLVLVNLSPHLQIHALCGQPGLDEIDKALDLQPLIGERLDGGYEFWLAEELASFTDDTGRAWRHVLYTAPGNAGWRAIGIPPMNNARIRFVGLCGVTTTLKRLQNADDAARDALRDSWNAKTGETSDTRPLLDANSQYTLKVSMSWAGWRPSSPGEQPPASVAAWTAFVSSPEWSFLTAPEAATIGTALPPVDLNNEASFDPRSVARYLLGLEPDEKTIAPLLLDDPIRAHFQVDHVEQLLAKYGRELVVKIRRTDPPAGSVQPGAHAPLLGLDIQREALESGRLDTVDRRVIEGVRADSRCLAGDVNTGGVTLAITAELEPDAAYDLMLFAPQADKPDDETMLVARSHFRSSRWANVTEMLAALGFTSGERSPYVPWDFVAAADVAMPAAATSPSDEVFEAALREIGMDPWPVVAGARAVAIWQQDGNTATWRLQGLLLEAPEPIERGARCTVLRALAGSAELVPIRRNATGSRVLLAADGAGIAIDADFATLTLEVLDATTERSASRMLRSAPRIAYQELP